MNFFKLTLSYKGTNYLGWQIQAEGKTVQGELNKVLKKISHSEDIHSIASSRTDSGVHALDLWVRAAIPLKIDPESLKRGLNSLLPKDISVNTCEPVQESYNPLSLKTIKEYRYLFTLRELHPFEREWITEFPRSVDIEKMKNLSEVFVGEHDFLDFSLKGTPVKTTRRKVVTSSVFKLNQGIHPFVFSDDIYCFQIKGEGFLRQMVRLIMGSLVNHSGGHLSIHSVKDSLRSPVGKPLAFVAPPQGLYLYKVLDN